MSDLSIKELASILNGTYQKGALASDFNIRNVAIDSRTLVDPVVTVFFALVGERHDGHQYVSELYEKGVRCFVVSHLPAELEEFGQAHFIEVKDTLEALQKLASDLRNHFDFPVLAVTGSNGKTVVKEWLFDLLQDQLRIRRSPRSYNSQVGVPVSIWSMQGEADLGILEAGISKPGEMRKLAGLIRPELGILTNIGDAHQENFSSLEEKLEEKLQLFENARLLVFRADTAWIAQQVAKKFKGLSTRLFSWSIKGHQDADLLFRLEKQGQKTRIGFAWDGIQHQVVIPFCDEASIEDACHCLALILVQGWFSAALATAFEDLQPIAMRLELKEGINGCILINDFYNSDINSLEIALQFQEQQTSSSRQHKTVVLSDMRQSGFPPDQLYAEINRLLMLNKVSRLIGIGETIGKFRSVFQLPSQFFSSTQELLDKHPDNLFANEAILLKGAREFCFEDLAAILQRKYHQTRLEISLNTLVENLNAFRSQIKPGTKIMIMVKAFSYGSGTVEIARALEYQKVDYLAVAVADEGIELRRAGITVPIIVMNPEAHGFDAMIAYRLEPNVYSVEVFNAFYRAAQSAAVSDYPIHIKLETGMHRLGFSKVQELKHLAEKVGANDILRIQSVFSHLAATDESLHDDFTKEQYTRFVDLAEEVVSRQKNPVIRHLLNSAGIERFPEFQMEMVRLGIGLYGVAATSGVSVHPVARWVSTISQVKEVDEGETVGYGRKGKVATPKKVAVVPVGYADGYDRRFSNGGGKMWVNGHVVPVIGNVCMDMTMLDVTDVDVKAGDLVELMGSHIHLTDLAAWAGTIPYEILTGISQRVKRIYSQE